MFRSKFFRETFSFLSIGVLLITAINVYISDIDSQILAATNGVQTGGYIRSLLAVPLALIAAGYFFTSIINYDTYEITKIRRLLSIAVLLFIFSSGAISLGAVALDLAIELMFLLCMFALFGIPRFDFYFFWLMSIFLLSSSVGCISGNDYFLMSSSHDYACRGLTQHRNSFGPLAVFFLIYGMAIRKEIYLRIVVVLGCLMLVLLSQSATSQALFIYSFLIIALRGILMKMSITKISLPLLFMFTTLSVLLVMFLFVNIFADFSNRSDSFLIRLIIWGVAPGLLEGYLWVGDGYKSPIDIGILSSLSNSTSWLEASGFHNSFFELWRQFGLIGSLLVLGCVLGYGFWSTRRQSFKDRKGFFFMLAVQVYLFFGLVESGFGLSFTFWLLVLLRLAYIRQPKWSKLRALD